MRVSRHIARRYATQAFNNNAFLLWIRYTIINRALVATMVAEPERLSVLHYSAKKYLDRITSVNPDNPYHGRVTRERIMEFV